MHLDLSTSRISSLVALCAVASGCSHATVHARGTEPVIHAGGSQAVAIVRVALPWYAPRFVVRRKFAGLLAEYEANDAIVAKYFSISDAREFGGLYLWTTRGAAEAHFDRGWRDGVRARRGVDADVRLFDAPWIVDGGVWPDGEPAGTRSLSYPAAATWLTWKTSNASAEGAAPIAVALRGLPGLLRAFVVVGDGEVGAVALFADDATADAARAAAAIVQLDAKLGGRSPNVVRFEAPLLIDASLRGPVATAQVR